MINRFFFKERRYYLRNQPFIARLRCLDPAQLRLGCTHSTRAFCNTFDLHLGISDLEKIFLDLLSSDSLRQVLLYLKKFKKILIFVTPACTHSRV